MINIRLYIISSILLILLSLFIGYYLKKCPTIDYIQPKTTIKIDTVYKTLPKDSNLSTPRVYPIHYKYYTIDTTHVKYYTIDSIKFKNASAVIIDSTYSNDSISRKADLFQTQQIITKDSIIEHYVKIPPSFLSISGGIISNFNKTSILDAGPYIQLDFRNKLKVGYGYYINTKQNNLTLSIKIK